MNDSGFSRFHLGASVASADCPITQIRKVPMLQTIRQILTPSSRRLPSFAVGGLIDRDALLLFLGWWMVRFGRAE